MARQRPRNLRKEHHWRQVLARWQRSGMSIRAFCAKEGCSQPSFYFWRRELAVRDEQTPLQRSDPTRLPDPRAFVPVHVVGEGISADHSLEVVLRSGHLLRIPTGCDVAWLGQLITQLEQPVC